jgi:hypothetical protein
VFKAGIADGGLDGGRADVGVAGELADRSDVTSAAALGDAPARSATANPRRVAATMPAIISGPRRFQTSRFIARLGSDEPDVYPQTGGVQLRQAYTPPCRPT